MVPADRPSGADPARQPVLHGRVAADRRERGRRHQPDAYPDGPLVHVEGRLVDVEVIGRSRPARAEPAERPGDGLEVPGEVLPAEALRGRDRKSTRLNSSHVRISYAVFCLKKKKKTNSNFTFKKKNKKQ